MPVSAGFRVEGAILRTLREQMGWSRLRLAKEVGIHPTHLLRVERGERELGKASAQRIAGVLGIPMSSFYDHSESAVA